MLIKAPDSWPSALVAAIAMLVLAGLDLGGAFAAKEAAGQRSFTWAVIGLGLFVLLFWAYASSLQYADLAPVTFGWVVLLQVGVVLLDHYRYHATLPFGAWVAIGVIIVAQAYLMIGLNPSPMPSS